MSKPDLQPRGPMTHELKCYPAPFLAVRRGLKGFEYRMDDRDYREGDTLQLKEFYPATIGYSGREITVSVTYILRGPEFGIPAGYCIMSITHAENPAGLAPNESAVLLAMAKGTVPVTEQALIKILGTMAINRWLEAGLVEWHEPSPHTPAGAYSLTDKGRLAAVGATPDPQEGGAQT